MFTATLDGQVLATSTGWANLEARFKGTAVIIKNEKTGVSWPADPAAFDAEAEALDLEIQFDAAHASAPIRWRMPNAACPDGTGWHSTPYQTSDAGHCAAEAEKMVRAWLALSY